MSKSIEIYFDLKLHQFENNEENVDLSKIAYLFRIGVFYLFFNNDAIKFSKLLNLQIVKYGNNAIDCGFPVRAIEKYSKLINNLGYNFRIVVLEDSKITNNPYRVYKTNFLPIGNEEELLKNELNFVGEVANYDNRIQGMYIKNLHNNKLRDDIIINEKITNNERMKEMANNVLSDKKTTNNTMINSINSENNNDVLLRKENEILYKISKININSLTPMQAMADLDFLIKKSKEYLHWDILLFNHKIGILI